MKIKEILDLTQTMSLSIIARDHLSVGRDKAKQALQSAECYATNGVKGWFYNGDDLSILEQSIYDFVDMKINCKPKPNVTMKEPKNDRTNETITRTKETTVNDKEPSKEQTNVVRKRSSFDLDVTLMKQLKIKAIEHDRNVYEIVETAIRQYLKDLE